MPSEKVVGVLDRLGIEVPADEFGHYGVKGTRTNQGTIGAFVDKALGRSKKKFPVTTYQVESFKIKGSFKG